KAARSARFRPTSRRYLAAGANAHDAVQAAAVVVGFWPLVQGGKRDGRGRGGARIESSLSSMSANLLMSGAAPFGAVALAAFGSLAAAGARSVPRPVLAAPAGYASAYDFLPSLTSYRDSPIFGEKRAPSATMLAAPAPQREAPIAAA